MIDTIHIRISIINDLIRGVDYVQRLLNIITVDQRGTKKGIKYIRGYWCNFRIEIDGDNISIKGSLMKYFKGNNLGYMTRDEIAMALKQLSLDLGLQVERGRISRIDIGESFMMTEPPKKYMDVLICIPRADYSSKRHSKTFERSCTSCIFYDKLEELKKKDPATHKIFNTKNPNSNLLRFEIRFQRQLPKILHVKKVKVAMLLSSSFLEKLAFEWFKMYQSVVKENQKSYGKITGPSELKKVLMYEGLQALGGIEKGLMMVDLARKDNGWNYASSKRAKDLIKALSADPFLSVECPFVAELNDSVRKSSIFSNYLQGLN